MKRFVFFMIAITVYTTALWSQNWVNFSSSEPGAPEVNLLTSNAQTVTFEVTIPGMYRLDTTVNNTAFSRLLLPDGIAINPEGSPELPVLTYRVAIPACTATEIEYQVISQQNMMSCLAYPVPHIVFEQNSDGYDIPVEHFVFDSAAYAQPRSNEPVAIIVSDGAFRAQRYVEVMVQPVEYCPVTHQLSVIDKVNITLSFTNSQGDIRQNVGIFNAVATTAFINYEDDGISALMNDKAFEKPGFTPGNVQWKTLTDTAQACQIVADYLIICAGQFFTPQNADVQRLAQHRAFYNGFDVAIVNVENIISDALGFEYEGYPIQTHKNVQRMRTCIRRIYEGQNAQHTVDGKLGYVLLIGDCFASNTGMPTSTDHDANLYQSTEIYPSDYYFSCITKNTMEIYDDIGDLLIGRLSVENNVHLYNMVEKTIYFESEYVPASWRKSVGFTNGTWMNHTSCSLYFNFITSFLNGNGWNYSFVDHHNLPPGNDLLTFQYMNNGVIFAQYVGHGSITGWEKIGMSNFPTYLNNNYKPMFVTAHSCSTGHFDNAYCIGEFLTRDSDTKGAVGYIGATRTVWDYPSLCYITSYQVCYPNYLFSPSQPVSIAGELMLKSKITCTYFNKQNKYAYNLLGDPALNIMAEGYEITRDITAECPAELTSKVTIRNGATLTIPSNCTLNFLSQGQLIIEDGALDIKASAQINGQYCETSPSIHVKGGEFTVGYNVAFHNIDTILLDNYLCSPTFYDGSKLYNLSNVIFNNTPIKHQGTKLNIFNCTLNQGSNVKTSLGVSHINNCTFNQSTFKSSDAIKTGEWQHTIVSNCHFTGINTNDVALQIDGSKILEICNNQITGYGTGIKLTSSGATTAYYYGCRTVSAIHDNEVSNCDIGIEIYNSILNIANNNIYDNNFGVKLFNNTTTSFIGFGMPNLQPQVIQNNNSYELYASLNSFPTIFRFNQVIDEDNLGNSSDDPMVYWDLDNGRFPASMVRDVKFNCWGQNFDPLEDFYPSKYYNYDSIWCPDGKSISIMLDTSGDIFQMGLNYFSNEDFINAESTFKELIEIYPQSQFSIAALHELFALEQFIDNDYAALHDYYATFTPADSTLFDVADFLATRCNVTLQNWEPAIDWYEDRIENPPSYQDSIFAVIDLGDIHLSMESDSTNLKSGFIGYGRYLNLIPKSRSEYEENKAELLATLPKIDDARPQPPLAESGKKGVLRQNIPNPATGSTTVVYDVVEEGAVELRLYNQLGQLLQALPQGTQKPGSYRIEISLAGLPSAMYHYILFIEGEKADAKKLIVN